MPKDTINAEKLKDYWRNYKVFYLVFAYFLEIFSQKYLPLHWHKKIEQRLLSLFL